MQVYLVNGKLYIFNMKTKVWDSVVVGATEEQGDSSGNLDGGTFDTNYGGNLPIDGGTL